jgi:hypothetical protein
MSQADYLTKISPELMNSDYKDWARCVEEGLLTDLTETIPRMPRPPILDVRESPRPPEHYRFGLPVKMHKLPHQPHLENFFDAIRGKGTLSCPAEVGYRTAAAVLKVNEAVQAGRKLEFQPDEFAP